MTWGPPGVRIYVLSYRATPVFHVVHPMPHNGQIPFAPFLGILKLTFLMKTEHHTQKGTNPRHTILLVFTKRSPQHNHSPDREIDHL